MSKYFSKFSGVIFAFVEAVEGFLAGFESGGFVGSGQIKFAGGFEGAVNFTDEIVVIFNMLYDLKRNDYVERIIVQRQSYAVVLDEAAVGAGIFVVGIFDDLVRNINSDYFTAMFGQHGGTVTFAETKIQNFVAGLDFFFDEFVNELMAQQLNLKNRSLDVLRDQPFARL